MFARSAVEISFKTDSIKETTSLGFAIYLLFFSHTSVLASLNNVSNIKEKYEMDLKSESIGNRNHFFNSLE